MRKPQHSLNYSKDSPGSIARIVAHVHCFRGRYFLVGCVLFVYVATYATLSCFGQFEPAAANLGGVKAYEWAPLGYVKSFKWNRSVYVFFCPIHLVDIFLWHTESASYSGKYPVHIPRDVTEVLHAS